MCLAVPHLHYISSVFCHLPLFLSSVPSIAHLTVHCIFNPCQEETQEDTESEDEEQQIYNPLKLPMGWDGKPIPYWLYKLHGLGQVLFICPSILETEIVIFSD